MLHKISRVIPGPGYLVRLEFEGGGTVQVDFSSRISRGGRFAALADPEFFKQVSIGQGGRSITWPDELDFCADALWLEGHGQTATETAVHLKSAK